MVGHGRQGAGKLDVPQHQKLEETRAQEEMIPLGDTGVLPRMTASPGKTTRQKKRKEGGGRGRGGGGRGGGGGGGGGGARGARAYGFFKRLDAKSAQPVGAAAVLPDLTPGLPRHDFESTIEAVYSYNPPTRERVKAEPMGYGASGYIKSLPPMAMTYAPGQLGGVTWAGDDFMGDDVMSTKKEGSRSRSELGQTFPMMKKEGGGERRRRRARSRNEIGGDTGLRGGSTVAIVGHVGGSFYVHSSKYQQLCADERRHNPAVVGPPPVRDSASFMKPPLSIPATKTEKWANRKRVDNALHLRQTKTNGHGYGCKVASRSGDVWNKLHSETLQTLELRRARDREFDLRIEHRDKPRSMSPGVDTIIDLQPMHWGAPGTEVHYMASSPHYFTRELTAGSSKLRDTLKHF